MKPDHLRHGDGGRQQRVEAEHHVIELHGQHALGVPGEVLSLNIKH